MGKDVPANAMPAGSFAEARRTEREALPVARIWADSPPPSADLDAYERAGAVLAERKKGKRKRAAARTAEAEAAAEAARAAELAGADEEEGCEDGSGGAEDGPDAKRAPVAPSAQDDAEGAAGDEDDDESSDDDFGPMPLQGGMAEGGSALGGAGGRYGGALRPGEGDKMAAFVQANKRVPRRGEVAYSGEQIVDFERQGYVMSGSRNQRMNAVRIRKENQVYSAEEKAALMRAQEERDREVREQSLASLAKLAEEHAARPLPRSLQERARQAAAGGAKRV